MNHTTTVTVQVPTRFWDDHINRGCTDALEIKGTGNKIRVTLDHDGWSDLLSDSGYYIEFLTYPEPWERALAVSAAWTLSALAKIEIPWEPTGAQLEWLRDLPRWAHPKNWASWTGRAQ